MKWNYKQSRWLCYHLALSDSTIQWLTLKVEKQSSNNFSCLIKGWQENTSMLWHHTLAIQCCQQWIFTWPMQSATTFSGYHWQYIATLLQILDLCNISTLSFYWKFSCVRQLIQTWIKHFLWPKIILSPSGGNTVSFRLKFSKKN